MNLAGTRTQPGTTLAQIVTILAVIAVLAAGVLAAYHQHRLRAYLSEARNLAIEWKPQAVGYHVRTGSWLGATETTVGSGPQRARWWVVGPHIYAPAGYPDEAWFRANLLPGLAPPMVYDPYPNLPDYVLVLSASGRAPLECGRLLRRDCGGRQIPRYGDPPTAGTQPPDGQTPPPGGQTPPPPEGPVLRVASTTPTTITVTWDPVPNAQSYTVSWKTLPEGPQSTSPALPPDTTGFTVQNLQPSSSYLLTGTAATPSGPATGPGVQAATTSPEQAYSDVRFLYGTRLWTGEIVQISASDWRARVRSIAKRCLITVPYNGAWHDVCITPGGNGLFTVRIYAQPLSGALGQMLIERRSQLDPRLTTVNPPARATVTSAGYLLLWVGGSSTWTRLARVSLVDGSITTVEPAVYACTYSPAFPDFVVATGGTAAALATTSPGQHPCNAIFTSTDGGAAWQLAATLSSLPPPRFNSRGQSTTRLKGIAPIARYRFLILSERQWSAPSDPYNPSSPRNYYVSVKVYLYDGSSFADVTPPGIDQIFTTSSDMTNDAALTCAYRAYSLEYRMEVMVPLYTGNRFVSPDGASWSPGSSFTCASSSDHFNAGGPAHVAAAPSSAVCSLPVALPQNNGIERCALDNNNQSVRGPETRYFVYPDLYP